MAAAAAVASVAPVVSAQSETTPEFSDVSVKTVGEEAYNAIHSLAEQGIVTGYQNGKFGAWDYIKRVQVAKMFQRAKGVETPADVEKVLSQYNDVANVSDEDKAAIAAVTEAGFFSGNHGAFMPEGYLTREQMATILVRTYGLGDYNTGEDVEVNFKGVSPYAKESVQILANLGITTEAKNFNPQGHINRANFSVMLQRTMDFVKAQAAAEIESVKAVGAKTLEVKFNKAVDPNSKVEVVKSNIKQNVSETNWASDNTSVTIELTSKLTEGEYTVNVAREGAKDISGSVKVENEKVSKIEILSDVAVVDKDDKPSEATVAYRVTNQYGEDVTKSTNLTTNSETNVKVNPSKGVITLANLNDDETGRAYKVGDKLPITLVHADTATTVTKTVTLSKAPAVTEVGIDGVYNENGKALNEDTNLSNDDFYLVLNVKDQYGKTMTDVDTVKKGLIKTETNPTVIKTNGEGNVVGLETVTVNGEKKLAMKLVGPVKAGESTVTLISTTNGATASYKIKVAETTRTDKVTLSAPEFAVAGEDILVPATVLDKEGNEVKDTKVLNDNTKGVKVTFNGAPQIAPFVTDKDGNVFIKVSAAQTGVFAVVAQSSTFNVATQTINVKEAAKANTIRGLKKPLTFVAGSENNEISVDDVIVEDQYGRQMKTSDVKDYLTKNNITILVEPKEDSPEVVEITNGVITANSPATIKANDKNGTETLKISLADSNGNNPVAASTADAKIRVTDGTEYDSYEIEEIGKIQAADVENAGAKEFTVNGLIKDSKVKLDQNKGDFTATISGGKLTAPKEVTNNEIVINEDELNTNDKEEAIDTQFTLKVTINATGKTVEQTFVVSPEESKVQDFFFTSSVVSSNESDYDVAKEVGEATVASGSVILGGLQVSEDDNSPINIATKDQYGNKKIVDLDATAASTVNVTPEKASDVTITDNGTKNATVTLKNGVEKAGLIVKVKVGNATKSLKVTVVEGSNGNDGGDGENDGSTDVVEEQ
ncbi:S-layer homology domain-containing protein [Virgibacillus sp. 179-BFC.A HS]|uniref:S-layer homology domain-containing protein n=1 Tax=Tigheibacillus jepli TaxID=3035914 RepID=A0ABU5CE85_9BACI|nr:S-layer homology domain-containing protein [Virgibacillus sp. 179-BFC.A HS]MDY0404644.1 S-layer homology domain-containing protein [Virgibacillus sp. 179-BFC.A HS]